MNSARRRRREARREQRVKPGEVGKTAAAPRELLPRTSRPARAAGGWQVDRPRGFSSLGTGKVSSDGKTKEAGKAGTKKLSGADAPLQGSSTAPRGVRRRGALSRAGRKLKINRPSLTSRGSSLRTSGRARMRVPPAGEEGRRTTPEIKSGREEELAPRFLEGGDDDSSWQWWCRRGRERNMPLHPPQPPPPPPPFLLPLLAALLLLCSAGVTRRGSASAESVISVNTGAGLITGTLEVSPGPLDRNFPRRFAAFRGIPYARPPVGRLRWKDPEQPLPWTGDLNARDYSPVCPQLEERTRAVIGQEDCLYLNVFSPVLPTSLPGGGLPSFNPSVGFQRKVSSSSSSVGASISEKRRTRELRHANRTLRGPAGSGYARGLPVLVFVHGGDFISGSASIFGPEKLMQENVVLVTFNYRLGVLGFLSTGDYVLPGNFGLADQIAALQWVQANVRDFGGDPDRVTLVGQGSGAASVHYLMMSPRSKGLFHKVVLESGSALCDWAFERDPFSFAKALSYSLNCGYLKTTSLVDCLRGVSVQDLVRTHYEDMKLAILPLKTVPVVDYGSRASPIVRRSPEEAIRRRQQAAWEVPVIIGQNTDEGLALFLRIYLERRHQFSDQNYKKKDLIREILSSYFNNPYEASRLTEIVYRQYFQDKNLNNPSDLVSSFTKMLTDMTVTSCVQKTLRDLTEKNTGQTGVFSYVFSYRSLGSPTWAFRLIQEAQKVGLNDPLFYTAVSHGDELSYLFQIATSHPVGRLQREDMQMSFVLCTAWATFAQFGIPRMSAIPVLRPLWLPSTRSNRISYNISFFPAPMVLDYKQQESKFWEDTVPYVVSLSSWVTWMERWRYDILFWVFFVICLILVVGLVVLGVALRMSKRSRSYSTELIAHPPARNNQ